MCAIRWAIKRLWVRTALRTCSFLLTSAIILTLEAAAFAQGTFTVGSTPVTGVISTGITENTGDITFTVASVQSPAGTSDGTITVYYSGAPITSDGISAANIVATGGLAAASINQNTNLALGNLIINVPAGGAVGDWIRVTGIRVAVANTGLTSLNAQVSSVANAITAGQTVVQVISSIVKGIVVTGTAVVVSGSADIKVQEGFLNAFGALDPTVYPGSLGIRIALTAIPAGMTLTFPLTPTVTVAGNTTARFTATDAAGGLLAANVVLTSASTYRYVYYRLTADSDPFQNETLDIPVAVDPGVSTYAGAAPISAMVSLYPIGTVSAPASKPIPRYAQLDTTVELVTFASPSTNVTVLTNPAGLKFALDGQASTAPLTFSCIVGTNHSIAAITPQILGGARYVFGNWSDGGAESHTITCPASATTFTARFTTQYQVTTRAFPNFGGSVNVSPTPTDGYFESGSSAQFRAVPNSGYYFTNWSDDLTGTTNPQTLPVSKPLTVTANFVPAVQATISSLNPTQATAGGPGFTIIVGGSNFLPGGEVHWNGVAQPTTFVSSSQATANIDPVSIAFPGTASITFASPGGTASNSLPFTINSAPSPTPIITSVSPGSASAGGPDFDLQVYGSDFVPESIVRWNGRDRFTTFLSSRQLRAVIAAADIVAAAPTVVTVSSPGGVISNPVPFALLRQAPVLTAINPPKVITGSPGFDLTVYGLNFDPQCTVQWNGTARPTTFVTSSVMKASIPAADLSTDGTGNVTVSKADAGNSSPQTVQILTIPPNTPGIAQLIPDPVPAGGPDFKIRVLGSGFISGCRVQWNGQNRETTFISTNEVQAAILASDVANAGVYSIIVTNPPALADEKTALEAGAPIGLSNVVNPVPAIDRFSPASATAGDSGLNLVIEGRGFVQNATCIRWNEVEVPANFISSTRASANIPASDLANAGTINFVVSNPSPGGGDSDSRTFTVTPKSATITELYFPRLVSSLEGSDQISQNTGIAMANLSTSHPVFTLTAYDRLGAEISGPQITNPVSFALSGMEQRAVVGSQVFGPGMAEQNAIGWMRLQSPERQVAGFFLAFDNALTTLDGADVSSSAMTSFVFPEIEGQGFNQLHVANPNQAGTTVTFELYKPDGSMAANPVVRNLKANGAVAEYLTELFPGVTSDSGNYIRVSSKLGVIPFSYFGRPGVDAAGMNGQDTAKGWPRLYSPQYVVGGDMSTTLSVVNLDPIPADVTFRLIGDDGAPIGITRQMSIPGKGKAAVTEQDFFLTPGDQLVSGYVEIKSNGPRLAGSVVFGDLHRSRFTSALPLVSSLQNTIIFGQVASGRLGDWDYFTGIALLNPTDTEANATMEVYSREGKQVAKKTETIPAGRRLTQLLTEYFPALSGQAVGGGYIKITSGQALAGFALFGTEKLTALSAVPAQTVP